MANKNRKVLHITVPADIYEEIARLKEQEGVPVWQLLAAAVKLRKKNIELYHRLLAE